MNDKDNKRGFSGLSDLASDVSGSDNVSSPEPSHLPPKPSQAEPRPSIDNETEPKVSRSPGPIGDVRSGKSVGRSGWKWILGIIAVIFVIWLINYRGDQNSEKPSNSPPPTAPRSYDNRPSRSALAQEIKDGKERANQMEAEIQDMDARLQEYQSRLRLYRDSEMVDEHNMLVPQFNSLVGRRRTLYEEYSRLVDEVNSNVSLYNSRNR
jgi:hypothetical protein